MTWPDKNCILYLYTYLYDDISKIKILIHLCCLSVFINTYSRRSALHSGVSDRSPITLACPKKRLIEEVL